MGIALHKYNVSHAVGSMQIYTTHAYNYTCTIHVYITSTIEQWCLEVTAIHLTICRIY